jgi:ketosteroid isomerase-like protein
MTDRSTADERSVRAWLEGWGGEVASYDFDAAESRFGADVVGFGTRETVARGVHRLRADQWAHVWPAITDFRFDGEAGDVWISPDRCMAVIAAGWQSAGRTEDGRTFPRRGRATVVLTRDDPSGTWLGRHTHFSLEPLDPGTWTGAA